MTPPSSPGAAGSGGLFQSAAAYGVAAPRPGLLLLVLALIAACIVALTAIDVATLPRQIDSLSGAAEAAKVPRGALGNNLLKSSLFITALMGGVLALIAFGHNWARWVWMIVCMLLGALVALGTLVLMFSYAPEATMLKGAIYLLLFLFSCMLFAPSCNAWFRRIKEIRHNPRLDPRFNLPARETGAPADGQPYHPYAPPGAMAGAPALPLPLPPRPRSISQALALFLFNVVLGLVLTLVYLPDMLATQNVLMGEGIMKNLAYGGLVFGMAVVLLLVYFIARGSNVARWIWLAMAVLGFLNAYTAVKTAFVVSPLYGTLATLSQLAALIGTILLFVPASNRWMREAAQARRP